MWSRQKGKSFKDQIFRGFSLSTWMQTHIVSFTTSCFTTWVMLEPTFVLIGSCYNGMKHTAWTGLSGLDLRDVLLWRSRRKSWEAWKLFFHHSPPLCWWRVGQLPCFCLCLFVCLLFSFQDRSSRNLVKGWSRGRTHEMLVLVGFRGQRQTFPSLLIMLRGLTVVSEWSLSLIEFMGTVWPWYRCVLILLQSQNSELDFGVTGHEGDWIPGSG